MKKKVIVSIIIVALIMTIIPASALAHGHRSNTTKTTRYPLCPYEDCIEIGAHKHDGTYYCAHSLNDGHDYHCVCPIENCTKTGIHKHDGVYCYPHNNSDGHNYHKSGSGKGHGGRHHR